MNRCWIVTSLLLAMTLALEGCKDDDSSPSTSSGAAAWLDKLQSTSSGTNQTSSSGVWDQIQWDEDNWQ